MKIAIVFSLLVSILVSTVLSGTACPAGADIRCVDAGEWCGSNGTHTWTCMQPDLFCVNSVCKGKGTPDQACTYATGYYDCLNLPGSSCNGTNCTVTKPKVGLDDACTADADCASGNCTGSVCVTASGACAAAAGSCPYGTICKFDSTALAYACVNQSIEGDACTSETDCWGLLTCVGSKCAMPYKGALGDACLSDWDCGSCTACSGGKCAATQKDIVFQTTECNKTGVHADCTNGTTFCTCDSSVSELRCLDALPVKSYTGCKEFLITYSQCLDTNKCTLLTQNYGKWSTGLTPATTGCASKCAAPLNCWLKCKHDVDIFYGGSEPVSYCGSVVPTYTCADATANTDGCNGTTVTYPGTASSAPPSTTGAETTTATATDATTTATATDATTTATGTDATATTTVTGATTTVTGATTTVTGAATTTTADVSSTTGSGNTFVVALVLVLVTLFI